MAGQVEKFKRIDEDVYADGEGKVYEKKGDRFVPTGAKVEGGTALAETEEEFVPASALLVRPELNIEQAKKLWETFESFKSFILADRACYDEIQGKKEMNRTGATRLAVPFGLSIEERRVEEQNPSPLIRENDDVRFVVHVRVSKGPRFVDAVGTCRISEIAKETKSSVEIPFSQREHFAYTKAWTRATKRGIADILGGTEAD